MAHFIFSAFSDESGEQSIAGQIAACKANGIAEMELRGFGKKKNRTWYMAKKLSRTDKLVLLVTVVFSVWALWVTCRDGSRFYNPFI